MNLTTTATILGIFLTCVLVSFFYWQIVRVMGVRALRFRLFSRRDKLRRLALDGAENHHEFAYQELESFICKTISAVPSISLASFLLFVFRHREIESKEMDRFRNEASLELEELLKETVKDAIYLMALNSPILVFLATIGGLVLWMGGHLNKLLLHAERFVDELPDERPVDRHEGSLQPA